MKKQDFKKLQEDEMQGIYEVQTWDREEFSIYKALSEDERGGSAKWNKRKRETVWVQRVDKQQSASL